MTSPESPAKTPWKSKTLCLAVVTALTPIVAQAFPAFGEVLRDNADLACTAVGVVFGILRLASKGRISLGS